MRSDGWRIGVGIVCALSLPGCTAAGAGIGTGIDALTKRSDSRGARFEDVHVERGDEVSLTTAKRQRFIGNYEGYLRPSSSDPRSYVVLKLKDTDRVLERVPTDEIVEVGVHVPRRGWLYGTIVGAAIDVTIVVAVVITAATWQMDLNLGSVNGRS